MAERNIGPGIIGWYGALHVPDSAGLVVVPQDGLGNGFCPPGAALLHKSGLKTKTLL